MKNRKQINPPINPGISLLIVVFLVLCLFTFSAITLASSINEYNRSKTLGDTTKEYYDATNKAEQILAATKQGLVQGGEWTLSEPLDYTVDINADQALEVRLEPLTEPSPGEYFNITKWSIKQKGVWETDNTLNLIMP